MGFFIGLDACKLGVWTGMNRYELSGFWIDKQLLAVSNRSFLKLRP